MLVEARSRLQKSKFAACGICYFCLERFDPTIIPEIIRGPFDTWKPFGVCVLSILSSTSLGSFSTLGTLTVSNSLHFRDSLAAELFVNSSGTARSIKVVRLFSIVIFTVNWQVRNLSKSDFYCVGIEKLSFATNLWKNRKSRNKH